MAKIKKSEKHIHSVPGAKKNEKKYQWAIPAILIITFLAYLPVFNAGFVSWDDGEYVYENLNLKNSDLKSLLVTPMQGNWHPLTMLSLWFNYLLSGENAFSYHLLNLIFHLVNCYFVFRLAMLLSYRNVVIAFTTAILFGIHPMHVESVAWVSERKDVLYSLFFLAGLISYTKYADTSSRKEYLLTILFFILSLLSKPSAVIFPVALFSIDLLRKRKPTVKLFAEKLPFFVLALIVGILTFIAQREAGSFGKINFETTDKILYGFYGIMMYFIQMIAPVNLSVFYPFPPVNQSLPVEYYLAPFFFVALALAFYYSLKRSRVIAFGIFFYLINLLLVLQFFPVGSAVIAQRYTYIPYIGLFYIIGWIIDRFTKGNSSMAWRIIFPVVLVLTVLTWMQASVWHSSATLWDHAIKTHPSTKAYAIRAMFLRKEKNYDLALEYFDKAIKSDPKDWELYSNLGNVYLDLKKPELAMINYRKALAIKPDFHSALDNIGVQFAMLGQFDSAMKYSTLAINAKPDYKPAYSNRALTLMELKRYEEAIKDWEKVLQYEPGEMDIYNLIGSCYQAMGKYEESVAAITKAINAINDPSFYLNRAISYNALKNTDAAKQDALKAKQNGVAIPADLAKSLGIE